MSTVKIKNIKQMVINSTVQPLKLGGVAEDGSDAKITIDTNGNTSFSQVTGIKFPATQVPSSDANTLDDYEEGTWTPNTSTWTTQPTFYSSFYVKVGKIVYVSALFNGGVVQNDGAISGLPFTIGGHGICHWQNVSAFDGSTFGKFDPVGTINNKISNIPTKTLTGLFWILSGTYVATS